MMRGKEQLSNFQIAMMIMLFEIGSTPLFFIGAKAKQDAWLAMLIAAGFGLLTLWLFLSIQNRQPNQNLIGILQIYFGRIFGSIIGLTYILYFSYESMRNVRDFGELMAVSLLSNTPMFITMLIVILIAAYGIYQGVEVIFRMAEVLLPIVFISYLILILLIFITDIAHFEMLAPVMENGFLPVLNAAFPDIVSFPFGQMIVFLMFWHYCSKQGNPRKVSFLAYIAVAALLIFLNVMNIAVLGPGLAGISALPLLQVVQLISFIKVFERMDPFMTLLIYIGLFMKMIIFYLCAVLGLSQLTGKSYRFWIVPIGAVIFGTSFLEPNYTIHISLGFTISLKLFTVFQMIIPVGLGLTMLLMNKKAVGKSQ